jgi:hypothetical protein
VLVNGKRKGLKLNIDEIPFYKVGFLVDCKMN